MEEKTSIELDLHDCVCKLGWGYNGLADEFVDLNVEPKNVTKEQVGDVNIICESIFPNCLWKENHLRRATVNVLLKEADPYLYFGDQLFLRCSIHVTTRIESCEMPQMDFPPEITHFVNKLIYGKKIVIIIPYKKTDKKINLLKNFLKKGDDSKLDAVQQTWNCFVFFNDKYETQMSLKEVFCLIKEIQRRTYPFHERLSDVECHEIKNVKFMNTEQEKFLATFLTNLFDAYRRLEMKLQTAGFDVCFVVYNPDSLSKVCQQLEAAKNALEKVEKTDYFALYPVLKRLFFAYQVYLSFMRKNNFFPHEDEIVTPEFDFSKLFIALTDWFPLKANGKWHSCAWRVIVCQPSVEPKISKLILSSEWKNRDIILLGEMNDQVHGALYVTQHFEEIPIGLMDMSQAVSFKNIQGSSLKVQCPRKCSNMKQMWLCEICGFFINTVINCGGPVLFCKCGKKEYDKDLFRCLTCDYQVIQTTSAPLRLFEEICNSVNPKVVERRKVFEPVFKAILAKRKGMNNNIKPASEQRTQVLVSKNQQKTKLKTKSATNLEQQNMTNERVEHFPKKNIVGNAPEDLTSEADAVEDGPTNQIVPATNSRKRKAVEGVEPIIIDLTDESENQAVFSKTTAFYQKRSKSSSSINESDTSGVSWKDDRPKFTFTKNSCCVEYHKHGLLWKLKDANGNDKIPFKLIFGKEIHVGDVSDGSVDDLSFTMDLDVLLDEKALKKQITTSDVVMDDNGRVVLLVKTVDGIRKTTPTKIFAIFIKSILKLLEEKLGESVKEIYLTMPFLLDEHSKNSILKSILDQLKIQTDFIC